MVRLLNQKHHHEVAPSQHELGMYFGTLVNQADNVQLYKYVVQMVTHSFGKTATFMPKPVAGDNGSGMHIHQSIWKGDSPVFSGDAYAGLSETALHYIGGILKHAKAINAFANSTTNSYKRLVRNDGTLWTMGRNFQGALGHGDKQDYNSPRQVPGTTWVGDPVIAMNAAQYRKSDGTLWVCGNNPNGELGQNNVTGYSSPKQIPGTTWASGRNKGLVSEVHMVALKTDGTAWSWGRNQYGQLGLNQDYSGQCSSPTQIPGTTWNAVSGSRDGWNIATKTDGTMWAWGKNDGGILAQNNTTNYISPVQIPGTTWSTKFAAGRNVLAVKTDGTLWGWGTNDWGMLGQNLHQLHLVHLR